jgi:hypothetical protein
MATNIKVNLDALKSRREWKRHKVKDGHNIYRILPPFGESANGYPYRKWQIIWGLADPETGRMRPYASSMTSEKKCPVTEFVKELKTYGETLKAKLQAAGTSEDDIKERLAPLNKLVSDLNPKTVYIYNAVDKAGEIGLLELKSTAHKKLKNEMLDYIQLYNQDPTSLNSADDDSGVWFDVIRTGMGRDTEYDVKKCQARKKEGAKITFEDDRSPLPDSVIDNFEKSAYDLASVYQVKTYDDLADILEANMSALVAICPDIVNMNGAHATTALLTQPTSTATPKKTGKAPVNLNLGSDDSDDDEEVQAAPVTKPAPAKSAPVQSVADDDDFMAKAEALLNG